MRSARSGSTSTDSGPTRSPRITSGAARCVRRSTAWLSESKRQQKHPPAISSTGKPCAASSAVSARPWLWSLAISPTRRPCAERRRASCSRAVVLPAPRKPPIMRYSAFTGTAAFLLAAADYGVDGVIQKRHVAVDIDRARRGVAAHTVEPAALVGVGIDQRDVARDSATRFDELPFHHGVDRVKRLEPLHRSEEHTS